MELNRPKWSKITSLFFMKSGIEQNLEFRRGFRTNHAALNAEITSRFQSGGDRRTPGRFARHCASGQSIPTRRDFADSGSVRPIPGFGLVTPGWTGVPKRKAFEDENEEDLGALRDLQRTGEFVGAGGGFVLFDNGNQMNWRTTDLRLAAQGVCPERFRACIGSLVGPLLRTERVNGLMFTFIKPT